MDNLKISKINITIEGLDIKDNITDGHQQESSACKDLVDSLENIISKSNSSITEVDIKTKELICNIKNSIHKYRINKTKIN